ncbi:hypothetical protein, partial [Idiomarina xiamenensis]
LDGGINTYGYALANPVGIIDPTGEGPIAGAICGVAGFGAGAISYGLDWFSVASTSHSALNNELLTEVNYIEESILDLENEIKNCRDTKKKFDLLRKQLKLHNEALKIRQEIAKIETQKSFSGYMAHAALGAVVFGAACGSVPSP